MIKLWNAKSPRRRIIGYINEIHRSMGAPPPGVTPAASEEVLHVTLLRRPSTPDLRNAEVIVITHPNMKTRSRCDTRAVA